MRAYDIEMLKRPADRGGQDNHGWCFGLPPGIKPEQWPLDPNNGYPLMHGFTLLLPDDYRCHGPGIVALSFFATPWDMCDGAPEFSEAIYEWFKSGAGEPEDPDLRFFYEAERRRHPRLARMEDCLGCAYAVVSLTQSEFDGPLCLPPEVRPNRLRDLATRPAWLDVGAAVGFLRAYDHAYIRRALGDRPVEGRFYDQGFRWIPRETDPNAGVTPRDSYPGTAAGECQPFFFFEDGKTDQEHYRLHEWAKTHAQTHIGGTMRPVQSVPEDFGCHYIEFEEWFGGYNFGSGNAQLDFEHMKFDWACG